MTDGVTLNMTIGEVTTETNHPSEQDAVSSVMDAFIANFPDEDEVFSLPEPVDADDLRAFIAGLALDQEFAFTIRPA